MKKTMAMICAMTAVGASAGVYQPVGFTQEEINRHDRDVDFIVQEAATCLKDQLIHHREFYSQYGISPFYGDQSKYAKLVYKNGKNNKDGVLDYTDQISRKKEFLDGVASRLNRTFPDDIVDQIKPTSCIGLSLQCLSYGFKKLGEEDIWNKVNAYTRSHGVTGGALQHALQELGWKILYWNPDTSRNAEWDENEEMHFQKELDKDAANGRTSESRTTRDRRVFRGSHSYVYNISIQRHRNYVYNKVDNTKFLVNFGSNAPQKFNSIPFFLGVAHKGYHVFPGFYGEVIEGHSTRPLTDYNTIETDMFNPIHGGSPKASGRSIYRSGVVAVPPHHITDDEGPGAGGNNDLFLDEVVDYLWFN